MRGFLLGSIVEEILSEVLLGIVGFCSKGFSKGLGEDERDLLVFKVGDVGVLLAEKLGECVTCHA